MEGYYQILGQKFSHYYTEYILVRLEAAPFASGENNSLIINHGMGPKPIENANMNKHTEPKGKKLI